MGRKARRWKQAAVLLTAVSCMVCSVPNVQFTYAKDGAEILETVEDKTDSAEKETEVEEAGKTEDAGTGTEKNGTGDSEAEAAESTPETKETEEMESIAGQTQDNGAGNGETESGTTAGEPDTEIDRNVSGEPDMVSETEITAGEPDMVSETEDSEMEESEYLKEGVPVAHDDTATEDGASLDADYTDSNGVVYSYYGYADGTATIHTVTDYAGKDVNIPGEIGGYTVTRINADFPFGAKLASLTIPEPITYIGENPFWGVEIGALYYNAVEAYTSDNNFVSPFSSARIGEFYTGENVRIIHSLMFNMAKFTGSVALTVAEVESDAFVHAEFQELTLTDLVGTLHGNAFANADIQSLHYNTHAAHTASKVTEATFYQSRIYALDIGENVTEMPGYVFSGAYFYFNEFTVDLERIGDYAFHSAWPTYDPYYVELTVTENVKYLGAAAFSDCDIRALTLDAELETGAKDSLTGAFYAAKIGSLDIGENVAQIPDYLFCNAYVTQGTLNLNLERIGKCAFYDRSTITDLTIGENVKDIGLCAFGSSEIKSLHYNAVNATVGGTAEMSGSDGPFGSVAFSDISFGRSVESIPRYLFTYAKFSVESLDLPDSVTSIGNLAFYPLWSDDITIGNLTIGENVDYIGKAAFSNCSIGSLYYLAGNAEVFAAEKMGDFPFYGAELGSLAIGDSVTEIPAYLMGGVALVQDELVIPDSVTKIGTSAFRDKMLGSDIEIQTLVIGKNVSYVGAKAFADSTIQRAVVYAIKADEEYKALSFINTELPICAYAEIHSGSDFYQYFTKRTSKANITSMCRDFETVYGEEYFDAGEGNFVTPYTESCVACGYSTQGQTAIAAHTVKFVDYDGRVLSRQNVKEGASADAPKEPARTGYRFTGWDRGFENITEDTTVTAQYEIRKFTVIFKDGETVLKEQEVEYGKNAQAPENPSRPAEEWGTWEFAGWEGNYIAVTEDMTVQAKFTQKLKEYEVIFYDAQGNELSIQSVEHGKAAIAPRTPQKTSDAQYDYTFMGWSADYMEIKADTQIYPQYSPKIRSYTVTFLDAEDNVLDSQTIVYDNPAVPPEAPQKKPTAQYEYIFDGWDHDLTEISQDVVARPTYEAKTRTYKVTFADGDTVIDEQEVEYGSDATEPEEPTRQQEQWGVWKFVEWIGNFLGITKDENVQAVFEKVLNRYAVTFYDADGNVIETQFVEHGSAAKEPEAPEKEPTAEFAFDFAGWSGDLTNITETSVFYPVYESRTRSYAVIFLDAEGETLSSQTVEYGKSAKAPEAPRKNADAWNTYTFTGWNGDYTSIQGDMTLRPQYEAKSRSYTVTFLNGNTVIKRQTVKAGNSAELPEAPEREAEEWGTWEFAGWKGNYENVLKDETVEAVFEKELNVYTVIFEDEDGNIISEQEVEHGQRAQVPEVPERKEDAENIYIFTGWDGDTDNITEDVVFRPQYEVKSRSYTVTFVDRDTVIDRQTVKAGENAKLPEAPEREAEEWGAWEFAGWKGNYENVLKDETVEAVFEKELNVYTVIFEDGDGNIINEQEVTHGHGAILPKAPEKEPDEEFEYIFGGWDGDTGNITEDSVFSPIYEEQARYYTVTFISKGKTIDTQSVRYGGAASAPKNPVKEADSKYSYTFKCWDGDYSFITEDTTFHAVFEKTKLPPDDSEDDDKEPDDKDKEPDDKDKEPDDKDKEPGDKDKEPDDKDKEPGDKDKTPEDNGRNPENGDKEPENGKNPGTETTPESETDKDKLPQSTDKTAERYRETEEKETVLTEETDTHKKGQAGETESTEEQEPDDSGEDKRGVCALLFSILSGLAFLLFLLLFFLCYGKKKICGTVCRTDGTPAANQRIILDRIDGQEWENALDENETKTACTDRDGYFCFAGLPKGIYRVAFPAMQGRGAFTVTVCMTEDREDIFTVPLSFDGVKTEKKGRTYTVNVGK